VALSCHAKVNLTLDVFQPQADGMHPLRSIMQTVELHDTLTVSVNQMPGLNFRICGPESTGIPADDSNLIIKSLKLMESGFGLDLSRENLTIDLIKNIPSQAGLGGGSSNAAAMLLALRSLYALDIGREQLATMSRIIGSDVPFFIYGGTAIIEGTGEICRQIGPIMSKHPVVIAKGVCGVSTKAAYMALDADAARTPGQSTDELLNHSQRTPILYLHNDFQEIVAAIEPDVQRTIDLFLAAPSKSAISAPLLCGSGASVFRIYDDKPGADSDAEFLRHAGLSVFSTSIRNTPTTL
jgi:4-diphosphocytidyl-2-C-methyl-D-erythritol kinase